jgi:farnesyl diphosphate synthase
MFLFMYDRFMCPCLCLCSRITKEIIADLPTIYELPSEAVAWISEMIPYTVAGGKMNRGISLMSVQKTLAEAKGVVLTPRERYQSAALGWCIEFLQAFFLVADDVMDASVTRRGQPCWFRIPKVKLIAINDSFILESCVFKILKRYFGKEHYYPQLLDLFIEVTRQTEFGQLLDLTSQPQEGPIDLNRFTIERYRGIVIYKTAFYTFYLPVALGMIVSGITDRKLYAKAREILLIMGEYFQIQDDYLDCYGAPEVIGKIGTDIQDNKCSWLVVQALNVANAKQRKVLEENYGQHDPEKVEKVKKLYKEIGVEKIFQTYEEESYRRIQALIGNVKEMPTEVFEFLLRKIYKRSK